ncbi:uncharacterized protein LOC144326050 isoform X1 [Podarcis muralis]
MTLNRLRMSTEEALVAVLCKRNDSLEQLHKKVDFLGQKSAIEEDIFHEKDNEGKGEEESAKRLDLLSPDWVPSMSPFSSVSSLSSLDSLWDSLNEQSAIEEDISHEKDNEGKGEEETTARRLDLLSPDWVPSMSPFSSVSSLSSLESLWDSLNESASEVAIKEEEPQEESGSPPEEDGEDKEDREDLDLACPPPGEHLEASVIEDCEEERPPKTPTCLASIISRICKIFRRSPPPAPPVPPGQPSTRASSGAQAERRPLCTRLRRWMRQHRSCVHPEPRS